MQLNHITKKAYTGYNQEQLAISAKKNKFEKNEWMTFVQARSVDRKVKRGSKGTKIILVGKNTAKNKKTGKKVKTGSKFCGFTYLFNIEQTEKIEA